MLSSQRATSEALCTSDIASVLSLKPELSYSYARRNMVVAQSSQHEQSWDDFFVIPKMRKRLYARSPLIPAEPFPVLLPEELCAVSLFIYHHESRIWWQCWFVRVKIKKRPRKKRGQSNRECGLNHWLTVECNLGLARRCQKKKWSALLTTRGVADQLHWLRK